MKVSAMNGFISYSRTLVEAGFSREKTEAVIGVMGDMVKSSDFMTKKDGELLRRDIIALENKLLIKISTVVVVTGGVYSSFFLYLIQKLHP